MLRNVHMNLMMRDNIVFGKLDTIFYIKVFKASSVFDKYDGNTCFISSQNVSATTTVSVILYTVISKQVQVFATLTLISSMVSFKTKIPPRNLDTTGSGTMVIELNCG